MNEENTESLLLSLKASIDHPFFYQRAFTLTAKREKEAKGNDVIWQTLIDPYEAISHRLDLSQIQESCSVRNLLRARKLAEILIDDKGDIHLSKLPPLIKTLQEHLYSLGPQRDSDGFAQEHMLYVLKLLETEKNLQILLKKFSRPMNSKWAEELIRSSLSLSETIAVTDAHTKRAVLSAWLCTLRQNVGSCFATAPAEIIHAEQPERFLQDLTDLLSVGSLKRTFNGIENIVPLSGSWGSGELKKTILMRSSSAGITPEIWCAPGLIAAFESAEMIELKAPFKQKIEQIEGWIKPLILQKCDSAPFCFITAEEIIRTLLLLNLGITEKQLYDYAHRPKEMMHTELIVQPTFVKKSGTLANRAAHFLRLFESAKNAFKSLSNHALLKAWEFTLASFSDIKYELASWNFYSSLGLQASEQGGIGQRIYQMISEKVEQSNRKMEEIQNEYEMVFTQVKTVESRMQHTSTEKELNWLKVEYQSRRNEFYFLEEQRDEAKKKGEALASLYENLHTLYLRLFKEYFQEVYDPDMQEVTTGPFDDSPAGFRLLYKHGRTNTAQWTLIQNEHEFTGALTSFFTVTESEVAHQFEGEKIEREISDVVTGIITHVRTDLFLETAFHRMAIAHKAPSVINPLQHLDQIEKKPWVYTSGGTMDTLISCYYKLEDKPQEAEKWVENEMELLVFLADTLKQIPPAAMQPYFKGTEKAGTKKAMLMQSPTHAFLLQPTFKPFQDAWMDDSFTYTFLRDRFVRPAEEFIHSILLQNDMIRYLLERIGEKINENYLPRFRAIFSSIRGPLHLLFFREHLIKELEKDRGLSYSGKPIIPAGEIDGLLYSLLPLFPIHELKQRIQNILHELEGISKTESEEILKLFDRIPFSRGQEPLIAAHQLQDVCKALICLHKKTITTPTDYHLQIAKASQKLGYAFPAPLIFADTNWVKDFFAFVVNPGTCKLELWRVNYTGSTGYPMTTWKQWLNGSRPDLKWAIYNRPQQYGQV